MNTLARPGDRCIARPLKPADVCAQEVQQQLAQAVQPMSRSGDGHAGGTAAGPQQQVCECRAAVRSRQGWRSVALVYCVGRARVVANGPRETIAWRVAWGQGEREDT